MNQDTTLSPAPLPEGAPPVPRRPYDPEMIEEFLNQLLWELRIDHNRWACDRPGTVDRGPDDGLGLAPFVERHGSSLLPTVVVKNEGRLTAEERQRLRSRQAEVRQRQIEAVEILMEELVPDALRCARESLARGAMPPLAVELDPERLLGEDASRETAGS